ncbi:leucyl-tRNA synthetase [Rhizopus delemar RA 99-880]|uniref:leucine--tRNA ligase n=1 Tax=Rhizopus delemar (strain RA 99-880 / ATCC MYA-4621 / FGSC 9543 / NRRL 43880) TaxID=246409 RepID=I1C8D4_RHIO9|nr:leucyl-tRNA synthetase [Rhizopus delemar RA 99-880]|eukprot:EIE84714.1 leucyl-tRNA synthetase [Rhizopus delemar RA 99-880]
MSTEAPKTAKRDALREFEGKARALWDNEKAFEINAPTIEEHPNYEDLHKTHPKYMACMPYPYMNGRLHLGHAFTFSKVEFCIGYERMKGRRALLPQGFHCTGMPIKACADKLAREIEMFGKNFEKYDEAKEAEKKTEVNKNVKSKVAAKTGNVTYQFQIMLSLGIPITEIHKFSDPYYWTEFFPPQTISDMNAFGAKVDWRRAFITTDANPYYDSFVRWQMRKLREMQKIKFGERYTIYSIIDKQPCMDHDRASGEGVGPQEYTGIKMEVLEWSDAAKEALVASNDNLKGKKIYLVAATLRPETMYGQTNCFVGTDIKYGVYKVNENEAFVVTERAARNMAYQKIFAKEGSIEKLAEIDGKSIVGTKIHAPLSQYSAVYVLPMDNVLSTKGTGVVTSVPSDSPDDYATLCDLKKKPDYYNIKAEWVAFDPVPLIETPSYGNLTAPKLCEIKKINSQKDRVQLAEAKELAYKEAFYQGVMCIGEFSGMAVQEAKNKVKDILINSKEAFVYNEPEGLVMSRSGDECVVALLDQWYIDYGEEEWKAKTKKCLSQMNTYTVETRHQFEQVLDWLNKWACARSFGLGTKLPWDEQFLVESLSDSTIYMAYYTVAHLLHNDLKGSSVGSAGITAEQMTDSVWNYIFRLGEYPVDCGVPQATLDRLRREYEYFYPLDLRASGKDLVPNHLTFFLYNHTAIFPEDKWPQGVRSNGHLLLDSKKMSKSTGNFMTMSDAVIKYGADATRFALADAGDSVEDANFEDATANAAILRLYTLLEWSEEQVAKADTLRTGEFTFFDKIFVNEMNKLINLTEAAYDATCYREVLKYGVYEFQAAKDAYQVACTEAVLKKEGLVVSAPFPKPSAPVDESLEAATRYIRRTTKAIRDAELNLIKKKKKGKAAESEYKPSEPKSLKIFVATKFPEWQEASLNVMKVHYNNGEFDDVKIRQELGAQGMLKDKKVMPFIQEQKKLIAKEGPVAFNRTLIFNEVETLEKAVDELKRALGFHTISIFGHDQWPEEYIKTAESAVPGVPSFSFKNESKE